MNKERKEGGQHRSACSKRQGRDKHSAELFFTVPAVSFGHKKTPQYYIAEFCTTDRINPYC
ncbi:MAG: hypothetical protein D3904_04655 [Candidatus Electrothrix sp. EH2]|nr:hypothetical protein [Candidatus Electrothrix sp. EH2]